MEIRRLQDLPPKFCKGALVTPRRLGKVKVGEVFRALGYGDLIALVGTELQGLGIFRRMDHRGHKARLRLAFQPYEHGSQDLRSDNPCARAFHSGIPLREFHVSLEPVGTQTHTHTAFVLVRSHHGDMRCFTQAGNLIRLHA